jgi:hypothetical protein
MHAVGPFMNTRPHLVRPIGETNTKTSLWLGQGYARNAHPAICSGLRAISFDLIFTDLAMPEMVGLGRWSIPKKILS